MPRQHHTQSPRRRKPRARHTRRKTSFLQRLFGTPTRRWAWVGGLLVAAFYVFLTYRYIVAPYALRWQALYGEIEAPKGYSIHGIDISHYQDKIDWEALTRNEVSGEPLRFVVIKATEGESLLDPNFNDNFYWAGKYGFIRGAYHFFRPEVSGIKQAEYFLHQAHLEPGDLPPVLDVEERGNLDPAALRNNVLLWLHRVEEAYGVPPIIYSGFKFKEAYLSTPEFERYPFWIAHYYVKECGYKGKWKFWQHTDVGHVRGIKGNVDLNIYNGSMYELRRLLIPEDAAY